MTRWARNKSAQKHGKLPEDSTPWTELKASVALRNNTTADSIPKINLINSNTRRNVKLGNKSKERKRVNSFVITPIGNTEKLSSVSQPSSYSNDLPLAVKPKAKRRKLTKEDKSEKSVKANQPLDDSNNFQNKRGKEVNKEAKLANAQTEEEKLQRIKKKEKYREQMIKKRNDRGIQLLSPKIERKIYNVKKGMRRKGLSGDKIKEEVRKMRRTEELRLRKDNDKLCLRCRQPGHKVADCLEITGDVEQSMGVCFKCGSTEHKLSQCTSKSDGLPFAKCFVCAGLGHLSSNCPKNPRGKYPKGGSCKVCGSINHFANDCPQDQRYKEDEPSASVMLPGVSADLDEEELEENQMGQKLNKKTIIFC